MMSSGVKKQRLRRRLIEAMDRYEINYEICKLIGSSIEPLEDLKSIIKTCSVLWDQQITVEDNGAKKVFLKTREH